MKIKHILRAEDFVHIIRRGKKLSRKRVQVFFTKSPDPGVTSVGIVIARKTEPLATKRNYMRRVIYSFFREKADAGKQEIKIVVRVDGTTRGIRKKQIGEELKRSLEEIFPEIYGSDEKDIDSGCKKL